MADQPEALLQRLERLGQDSVGNYGMPICAEAAAELRRLHAVNAELTENLEKKSVAIQRIWKERDELRKVNAELLAAMISFTNSAYIKKHHPKRYAAAMAAIAKAEAEK